MMGFAEQARSRTGRAGAPLETALPQSPNHRPAHHSAATAVLRAVAEGTPAVRMNAENLRFFYSKNQVLHDVSMKIHEHRITALIGPSGCGKSTFLRTFNRMYENVKGARLEGSLTFGEQDVRSLDLVTLRRRVGMVFQKPNPFPKSIFENVAYGMRINRLARGAQLRERVAECLVRAALWDEVKDKLHASAHALSGGQQQRLCIARALATNPEVLLFDEPCSALDPIATARIEDLMLSLRQYCTIVLVTHNMHQAGRVGDYTGFFMLGRLVEFDTTKNIFGNPAQKETEDYITGRFG
jgi:phosphate transport system ATP-binding protein